MSAVNIITVDDAKVILGIRSTDVDAVNYLNLLIGLVSNFIEERTGRIFGVQSITAEIHNGDGSRFLYPKYFPIIQIGTSTSHDISKLEYQNYPGGSWSPIEDEASKVLIDNDNTCIELYEEIFPIGWQNIRIAYKAGWATVPFDIQNVAYQMVQDLWNKHKRGGIEILGKVSRTRSEAGGTFTDTFRDLSPDFLAVIDRYRVPALG